MAVHVGTSGFVYRHWRGIFYPEDLPAAQMLAFYASRFPSVEINNTFYRMPTEKLLKGWSDGTPGSFTFTLKAPRRITHDAKLQRCEDTLQAFCRAARTLGPKLAVLLFQLPPNFKKNVEVLLDSVTVDNQSGRYLAQPVAMALALIGMVIGFAIWRRRKA